MVQGFVHPDFGSVTELLRKYTTGRKRHGAAIAVYHRGEKVVDAWAGTRDADGRPWEEDTMAMSFSTTKGVASTALHVCVARGWVEIDAPVATYWPEFAQAGKEAVTVRHVLTHQAGLHRLRGLPEHVDHLLDWDAMVELLAAQPSSPPAGTGPGYHAITYGYLVGEIVKRVSGLSLGTFIRKELAEPLQLDGLNVGVPADHMHRVAHLLPTPTAASQARLVRIIARLEGIERLRPIIDAMLVEGLDDLMYDPELRLVAAEVPALNGVFTARSLARLYATLGNGGELDGVRILPRDRVAAMTEIQVRKRDYCIGIDMRWREGYHQAFTASRRTPQQGFGHYGYGGSGAWADPESGVALGFVTNDLSRGTTPFADMRLARLSAAALASARRR